MKKILDKIVDVLIVLVLVVSLFVMMLSLTSKSSGISNIFGKTILTVQTDSMVPTFEPGDLLISDLVTENQELEVGDVVTYETVINGYIVLNTHRIIQIDESANAKYYTTKGDNVDAQDNDILSEDEILAVWHGTKVKGAGKVVDYLQSKSGFFVCVLLPMIVFFIYSLIRFIKNAVEYSKEKAVNAAKEAVAELTEEQKQKAIQEYLDSQKNKQE